MDADSLIHELGYQDAPGFLEADRWHEAIEYAHVFRHTAAACSGPKVKGRFRGVYVLSINRGGKLRASTPIVYICEAPDERAAEEIHRLTWNQSVAPFLIVHTPAGARLYSGFDYEERLDETRPSQRGVLEACIAFNEVADKLDAFRTGHIDDGTIWEKWEVDPSRRVDVRLLEQLAALGRWLHDESGLDASEAHALVGRFVYLRYLRDRGILTDSRVHSWDLDPNEVFGRGIRLKSFYALLDNVDQWLNGSIFPLARSGDRAPKAAHVQMVAAVMLGDEVDTGQMHLNFKAYDFSHIPIELLSSIYEQFMALEGRDEEAGAYYTPIPLVNFVLRELDDLHPLQRGMRVFDPACGSGAFLVQCYQLLLEKCRQEKGGDLSPRELRELLTEHIFGLDSDEDACRVTELSLALALLDHIPTEVLARAHNFKLPSLHGRNIFQGDFFDATEPWRQVAPGFDWIVGNPPWAQANASIPAHAIARAWIKSNSKVAPVCSNQIAQAFAWKAPSQLHPERLGIVAFVIPAMTLVEKQISFRKRFFSHMDVMAVANLANFREVLFGGRARLPAAVIFYRRQTEVAAEDVVVYSPMVLNQEANRPRSSGERRSVWTITVDHSEVRRLSHDLIDTGDPLPWKTSMWGSSRDLRLLRTLAHRFPTFKKFAAGRLTIAEGLQLRDKVAEQKKPKDKREALDDIPEVTGKSELAISQLREARYVHSLPQQSLRQVSAARSSVRKGRGVVPLSVCKPPHLILSATRTFAVYSEAFLVVPPRQIGIAGKPEDANLLRVLALYLGSSFVRYHQFLLSPQEGIRGGPSTLNALLQLPIPFVGDDAATLRPWVDLHGDLVALSNQRWALLEKAELLENPYELEALKEKVQTLEEEMAAHEREVDRLSARALHLQAQDEWLVNDLVNVRLDLVDGKVGERAAGRPSEEQLKEYALALRGTLDTFLDRGEGFRHAITVVHEHQAGVIQVEFKRSTTPHSLVIQSAETAIGRAIRAVRARMERQRGRWLYFDRNLVMYLDGKVFLFKPMQIVWWTRSQALADADQIISDLVAAGGAA